MGRFSSLFLFRIKGKKQSLSGVETNTPSIKRKLYGNSSKSKIKLDKEDMKVAIKDPLI